MSLDLTGFTNLVTVYCFGSGLSGTLNASGLMALSTVSSSNNALDTVNVSNCNNLSILDSSFNVITTVNVTGCIALSVFDCSFNSLTTLDVSTNTVLASLNCAQNLLTTLGVNTILNDVDTNVNVSMIAAGFLDVTTVGGVTPPTIGPPDGIAAKADLTGVWLWTVNTD